MTDQAVSVPDPARPSSARTPIAAPRGNETGVGKAIETIRRAFAEFLTIPTIAIVAFLALAGVMIWLDRLRIENGWPSIVPGTHESIQTLLGTIATSIITVTSITFSLLLIAVQQGAAALTSQVYDQFLRRRANQAYFGFFVGLALFCLVTLAAIHPNYTPVYGAIVAFVLAVVALYLLILLIYSTIDQMRPVMIVHSIRQHTQHARESQRDMLAATATALPPGASSAGSIRLASSDSGYITAIDVEALRCTAADRLGATAVVLLRSIGDYVSPGEDVIELYFATPGTAGAPTGKVAELMLPALEFDDQRDLDTDPAYGIEQLTTIGWTSTSTAKSNPQPGLLACWNLRDLVGSWYGPGSCPPARCASGVPVVYRDKVPLDLLRAFETLTVVASESMQHQTLAAVYRSLAFSLKFVPGDLAATIGDIALRSLSCLGDQVLTGELQESTLQLADALEASGRGEAAGKVRAACDKLAKSIGHLHSRGDRGG
jgi:hypothetical protein